MSGDNGDNHGASTSTPAVSKYMLLKVEIENEERDLAAKRRELQRLEREEREQAIYDIRTKIIAFGIQPRELYPTSKDLPRVAVRDQPVPAAITPPAATMPTAVAGAVAADTKPRLRGARLDGRTDKGVMPVKYQYNGQTWSGWARRPKWFVEALAAGITPEQMMVRDRAAMNGGTAAGEVSGVAR